MNIHRVEANSHVDADANKVALERGPIVYCVEGTDNKTISGNLILPDDAVLTAGFDGKMLNGIEVISISGTVFEPSKDGSSILSKKQTITAIPYFSWCNRGITNMQVWIPRKVTLINLANRTTSTH
jgi:uncharacterized protein